MVLCMMVIVIPIDVPYTILIIRLIIHIMLIDLRWILVSPHITHVVFGEGHKGPVDKLQIYHLMAIIYQELVKIRHVAYPEIKDKA